MAQRSLALAVAGVSSREWIEAPMVGRAGIAENRSMSQIAVRCHPYAPVATESLQKWLREEVKRLRKSVPGASIRLLRLSQPGPEAEIEVGWQIEIGGPLNQSPLDDESLAELLRDLRLLGLQPSVLGEKGTLDRDPKSERRRRRSLMPELDPVTTEPAQPPVPAENGSRDRNPQAEHHSLMPELDPGATRRARLPAPRENGTLKRDAEPERRRGGSLMPELDPRMSEPSPEAPRHRS